jgi:hypothetical protein
VSLAWLATEYGIYFARETAWHGLTEIGHPTDDVTGIGVIWFVLIGTLPVSIGAAVVAGFVSAWVNPQGHPAPTTPPAAPTQTELKPIDATVTPVT